jgi:hypothetical protein
MQSTLHDIRSKQIKLELHPSKFSEELAIFLLYFLFWQFARTMRIVESDRWELPKSQPKVYHNLLERYSATESKISFPSPRTGQAASLVQSGSCHPK